MNQPASIDVPRELWNKFAVARSSESVTLSVPVDATARGVWVRVSRADALLLAAWIVLTCDDDDGDQVGELVSLLRLTSSSERD